MKKRYSTLKTLIACMVILVSACQKDNQDFVYDKINDLKVVEEVTQYTVAANDSLIIQPNLVESMPSAEVYEYSWTLGEATTIVSTKKDLRIKATLSPGDYDAIFRAKSVKTGISAIFRYRVTVQGVYYGGWYVVHNQGAKGNVSLIRTDDVRFDNVFETQNNKMYAGKALSLYYSSSIRILMYFTDQSVYKFNVNDLFELGGTAGTLPTFAEFPFIPSPFYLGNEVDQFVIANGGLYMGLGPIFYPGEVLKPFSARIGGDYSLFSGVFISSGINLFYDNKYMRFMQNSAFDRTIAVANPTVSTSSVTYTFNLANVERKMIAFDKGLTNEYYYLMEDNAGERYLMSTAYASASRSVVPGLNQHLVNSPDIKLATSFATSTSFKHMYYSVGNKIYLHDMNANAARVIYTFASGVVVKDMELVRTTPQKLIVATNNGAAGEVYYFDMNNLGEFADNTFVKKFAGFGEISQITAR